MRIYTLGSNVVKVGKEERVLLYKSLKPTSQCIEAVKSANKTLGMISRTFMFQDKNTMLRLYKSDTTEKINCTSLKIKIRCKKVIFFRS